MKVYAVIFFDSGVAGYVVESLHSTEAAAENHSREFEDVAQAEDDENVNGVGVVEIDTDLVDVTPEQQTCIHECHGTHCPKCGKKL